jgi:ubiquinone/menaquinone biosynthesis C-methylase UbiE
MSLWGRIFAAVYDAALAGQEKAGLAARRAEVLREARGRVMEIGAGTGLNLPHYREHVSELVLFEPEAPMAKRLRARAASDSRATVVEGDGDPERLPFDADRFDCVVSTLVLCTVPDARATLREIDRVLVSGGRLLFIEHVRTPDDPKLAQWQDRVNPLQRRIAHGCNCNRDTPSLLESSPLTVERLERWQLPKAPPHVRPAIVGSARSR